MITGLALPTMSNTGIAVLILKFIWGNIPPTIVCLSGLISGVSSLDRLSGSVIPVSFDCSFKDKKLDCSDVVSLYVLKLAVVDVSFSSVVDGSSVLGISPASVSD